MPDFSRADHLPNLREGGEPPPSDWLPRQRRGTTPQMIGRYPDYDVLDNQGHWDQATRAVVLGRLQPPAGFRFFAPAEVLGLRALCDLLLAQDREPRVPVAAMVDQTLAEGRLDGYQYQGMPADGETWRRVLAAMEGLAQEAGERGFGSAPATLQEGLVKSFAAGRLSRDSLGGLDPKRCFSVCMRMAVSAFYSHPWAWNEIGFGGPAYPEGYMRRGPVGTREPHERSDARAEDPVPVARELEG
ncbi:MAG: gluconate 2-dehydrogenase subunit 3 family protein [Candidatus Dormibacteria bacterium]